MNEAEYQAVKATMPWKERVFQTPKGGLVQMIDKNGVEVPLFTMTRFLIMITAKIATGTTEKETPNAEPAAAN
jgi:hypothetical protein